MEDPTEQDWLLLIHQLSLSFQCGDKNANLMHVGWGLATLLWFNQVFSLSKYIIGAMSKLDNNNTTNHSGNYNIINYSNNSRSNYNQMQATSLGVPGKKGQKKASC